MTPISIVFSRPVARSKSPALAADLLRATGRENTMLIGVMHLLFAWATVAAALGVIARMR